jgi:hypothetical protein
VNKQLEKMGYNIGTRLIEDFLAKSNLGRCSDFREVGEVVAKVGPCLTVWNSYAPVIGWIQIIPQYLANCYAWWTSTSFLTHQPSSHQSVDITVPRWFNFHPNSGREPTCRICGAARRGARRRPMVQQRSLRSAARCA